MISKKRVLSVAAAVALSSSMATAGYLPLTGQNTDDKWVMFGVAGFHSDGASAGGTGAIEAGMFTITDADDNVAIDDDGSDELYGGDGAAGGQAMLKGADATKVLARIKRVDGTASSVEARVNVSAIAYRETDPVRTIYVKVDEDSATPLFAFSYKSALEGERLEFSTNVSTASDNAYYITINSENTYSNPAIAEYIPASDGTSGDDGTQLTSIDDVVDYDLEIDKAGTGFNPANSRFYLKDDHQNTAGTDDNLRLYSYNPDGIWEIYDSRNSFNDFTELEKGKGYWGKMDQTTIGNANAGGLVLGAPAITTQDYTDSGIAAGWNLLAFNGVNPDLRVATTGLIVPDIGGGAGDIILTDVSGNHSVTVTAITAGATVNLAVDNARAINQAVKVAKLEGDLPDTFNIVAIAINATDVVLLSNEKFSIGESAAGVLGSPTTLTGDDPLDASTFEDHGAVATLTTPNFAMSKYGEYALVVKPENLDYAVLDIRCEGTTTDPIAITNDIATAATEIAAATCISANGAHVLNTDYDATLLMAATVPFEVRDHTFTRVFDYTPAAGDGVLTFVSADADVQVATSTITGGTYEIITLTIDADVVIADGSDDTTFAFDGTTIGLDDGDVLADVIAHIAGGIYANWTVTDSDAAAGTIEFTANAFGANGLGLGSFTFTDGTDADTDWNGGTHGFSEDVTGVDATPDAATAVTAIAATNTGITDDAEIVDDGEQIIFRMIDAGSNEFQVLETGAADNLTPATSSSALAKGAISDVYSPNYFTKVALANTVDVVIVDAAGVDPIATDTVSITVTTPLGPVVLDPYTIDAADAADAAVFYQKFRTWVNEKLLENYLDTTMTVDYTGGAADEFDATVTFTGSDITDVTNFTFTNSGGITPTVGTPVLGTPNIKKGDLEEDLKYNFVLSPNYVLNGPLYEMNAAGYKALAMVTGTMNLTTDTVNWDGIDLTRKPSEWLLSQDYNLFTVDPKAGYWTFLEPAAENPLSFEATTFDGNYRQHFDLDGNTFNTVGGGIEVTVNGISEYDDRKSSRVVAIVGGSEVELSQDSVGSNVYVGQISSHELKELIAGEEHDIQIVVADGLGNRIPATSSGSVVDYKKPTTPVLTFTDGASFTLENPEDDGVTKYYLYNVTSTLGNNIPATGTEAAKLLTITPEQAASYNICATNSLSRNTTYTLKLFALDGDNLEYSNASDIVTIEDYMPLFKNSAIVTNTKDVDDATTSTADVKYTSACVIDDAFAGDSSMQLSSLTNLQTAKVAYEPKVTGDAVMITVHVDGGTENNRLARITYHPDYVGDTVFIQLGARVYRYQLPVAADAVASTEDEPLDISTLGTYLPGQSLGE